MSNQDFESDTSTENEEESNTTQTLQVHNVLNNTMHDQDDSIHDEDNSSEPEDDSSEENSVNEIQPYTENGEQNNVQEDELLTTNFEVNVENRKVEGLITHSTYQHIFKFKINSESNQELWGAYIDFQSIQSKWTIHAILHHMGFYMMRENHNTQSCVYINICQDGLYIASTTPKEILHMLQEKYKINIYLQNKYPHDPWWKRYLSNQAIS